MTEPNQTTDCKLIWQQLVDAEKEYSKAQYNLFAHCKGTLIELLRSGLHKPSERLVAFKIVSLLQDVEQRKTLFPDFFALACQATYVPTIVSAREAIRSLPHDWVLAHIEAEAARILNWDDDWEYRRFLETVLYS